MNKRDALSIIRRRAQDARAAIREANAIQEPGRRLRAIFEADKKAKNALQDVESLLKAVETLQCIADHPHCAPGAPGCHGAGADGGHKCAAVEAADALRTLAKCVDPEPEVR